MTLNNPRTIITPEGERSILFEEDEFLLHDQPGGSAAVQCKLVTARGRDIGGYTRIDSGDQAGTCRDVWIVGLTSFDTVPYERRPESELIDQLIKAHDIVQERLNGARRCR